VIRHANRTKILLAHSENFTLVVLWYKVISLICILVMDLRETLML